METGKAYAFFDCTAPREAIESELPTFRACAQTPSRLELSLIDGPTNLWRDREFIPLGDMQLLRFAHRAAHTKLRYVLEATYPGASNRETAQEVNDLLYQVYQSPLHSEGELFFGA